MNQQAGIRARPAGRSWTPVSRALVGLMPLIVLPAALVAVRAEMPSWVLMWGLSIAVFGALKWMTLWRAMGLLGNRSMPRTLAYLILWPGMDAVAFLDGGRAVTRPGRAEWAVAAGATVLGLALFWGAARLLPASAILGRGWTGLFGLIFMLHFGAFHLVSLGWRALGIDAQPLMRAPIAAASLGEFWSLRWNTAFHVLARDSVVQPLRGSIGTPGAVLVAFTASGLVHDLVISVPAGGGFGLPTAYFAVQGLALLLTRSSLGRRLGLATGLRGRGFAILITAAPAFWLFHPAFVANVMVPFMRAVGAL
ncbi:MAG: membrane bound O-acyl transferase family-domain-containing protein [Candidatus Dormibacteraeota bacterium]|nr:membrane bound O-acyl transferase family-domain-containing protein [Candidatus Dormibacteraeota bacterium]